MKNVIKDPIHGEIPIPKEYGFIDELLATKEMKRLARVLQLGECFNVFYSAVHTRYSHSIGVYYNAYCFIKSLNIKIPYKDACTILAAALLHDIGHGPRSHCFEKWTKHNHEEMTQRIITDKKTEVNKVLRKNKIDPKEVISIINHSNKNKFYYQIVSSQIDSDRLDYLCRDSYFTGTVYGKVDSPILMRWIDVVDNQLAFDFKAIDVIEDILFARAQMFKQIYVNKKVLVYEELLGAMIGRFRELSYDKNYKLNDRYNLYPLLLEAITNKKWEIESFLKLDDQKLNLIIESWSYENDPKLKYLTKNYYNNTDFICSENKQDLKNDSEFRIKEIAYPFAFSNKKEKIMIKTKKGLISLDKLNNELSLITKETTINYNFFFGLRK